MKKDKERFALIFRVNQDSPNLLFLYDEVYPLVKLFKRLLFAKVS